MTGLIEAALVEVDDSEATWTSAPALLSALCLSVAFHLAACNVSGSPRQGPCGSPMPPAACGRPCSDAVPCGPGLHCSSRMVCAAECTAGDRDVCGPGRSCDPEGRCTARASADAGSTLDVAIPRLDASLGDVPPPDTTCATVTLETRRVIPNVILVLDQSASMSAEFGFGFSRWGALRRALFDERTGLVPRFETSVRFGMAMYTGSDPPLSCLDLVTVPAALRNTGTLIERFDYLGPGGLTPTGLAIQETLSDIDRLAPERGPDAPTYFVLATDGEPTDCSGFSSEEARRQSVEAVAAAQAAGIDTFVISVGSEIAATHLEALARAGAGRADTTFYRALDAAGLDAAVRSVLATVPSCEVRVEGRVAPALACEGDVRLGSTSLECNRDWMLLDDGRTIRLLGSACDRLRGGSETLTARFPCEAVLD